MARYNKRVHPAGCMVYRVPLPGALVKVPQMAKAKAHTAAKAAPAAPAANPFAALLAPAAPATGAAPKVHSMALPAGPVRAANHVATLKGGKGLHANIAAATYTLGAKVYNPAPGSVNATQWAAVTAALASGPASGATIAEQFTARGLLAGHAGQFVPYAHKRGWLALA